MQKNIILLPSHRIDPQNHIGDPAEMVPCCFLLFFVNLRYLFVYIAPEYSGNHSSIFRLIREGLFGFLQLKVFPDRRRGTSLGVARVIRRRTRIPPTSFPDLTPSCRLTPLHLLSKNTTSGEFIGSSVLYGQQYEAQILIRDSPGGGYAGSATDTAMPWPITPNRVKIRWEDGALSYEMEARAKSRDKIFPAPVRGIPFSIPGAALAEAQSFGAYFGELSSHQGKSPEGRT